MLKTANTANTLLLLSVFFFGIAHIAFLPPWEGFDETAHYSYIKQLADTGTRPAVGAGRIAAEIDAYAARGPMPYNAVPPYENNGGFTYAGFFSQPANVLADVQGLLFGGGVAPPFLPGTIYNWEAQHPPLYYWVMAAVSWGDKDGPLGRRLLLLRVTSYVLAFAGFYLAFYANRKALSDWLPEKNGPLLAAAAWPLVLPMWYSDTARIGNDSLAILLMGLAWMLLLNIVRGEVGWRAHAALGAVLGLGCWTKAFFLPIAFGIGLYLLCRTWRARDVIAEPSMLARRITEILLFGAVLAAVALPLYLSTYLDSGWFLRNNDQLVLERAGGGLIAGLARHWSLAAYLHSIGTIAKSFVWSGAWSFGRPALFYLLPTSALVATVAGAYFLRVGKARTLAAFLPIFLAAPVLAGLLHHALVWIAIDGRSGVTPGWYFYILAGPIGLVAALGVSRLCEFPFGRRVLFGLTAAAAVFAAAVSILQILMYSGCAVKSGTTRTIYIPDGADCWMMPGEIFSRLDVIAYPALGVAATVIGGGLALTGAVCAYRVMGAAKPG